MTQPRMEFVRLAQAGEIGGVVLDVGCGIGENALYLANVGRSVWSIDFSRLAIEKARAKARQRGLKVNFLVWDVLELSALRMKFDSVIDSGLLHSLSNKEVGRYVQGLSEALYSGGTFYLLVISDRETSPFGPPRRISREEIQSAFDNGWKINYIREARYESNAHPGGALAWLSSITRL
jgi:cyclopropane fatty-acyl-phospholipid synthase-like methyltransferase